MEDLGRYRQNLHGAHGNPNSRQTRMLLASRLKVMLADLGLTPDTAAQALHVTPRTVRYWISGKTLVPYAAYLLLRVMARAELPCPGWDGWHMHSGKLWSPEGHGFGPLDSSWWGLLVRKARLFGEMYDRDRELDRLMARAGRIDPATTGGALAPPVARGQARAPAPEVAGAAQPPRLDLSNKHFGTPETEKCSGIGSDAIESVASFLNAKLKGVRS